jgi:hypothetical protein
MEGVIGILTASCAALTISGSSSVVPSPPDVALTATPLEILEPAGQAKAVSCPITIPQLVTTKDKSGVQRSSGSGTRRKGVRVLTALGKGHDGAGGGAVAGQRCEAERRGEAAGGGHGGASCCALREPQITW